MPKQEFTLQTFLHTFSDEYNCFDYIFMARFGSMNCCPKCACTPAKFYRIKKRRCYECGDCGFHLYPVAGTIIQSSNTRLTAWFLAIYMFSVSKNGISSEEVQRLTGVTYKTAWKMTNRIRSLFAEEVSLRGKVEIDESLIGGVARGKRGWGAENKICVFGMVEQNGKVKTVIVPDRKRKTLLPIVKRTVKRGSVIRSDKFRVYRELAVSGYTHLVENGSGTININNMEGYWSNFKKSIRGTHTFVSEKHLQSYLNEYSFRHNRRFGDIFSHIVEKLCNQN